MSVFFSAQLPGLSLGGDVVDLSALSGGGGGGEGGGGFDIKLLNQTFFDGVLAGSSLVHYIYKYTYTYTTCTK